MKNIQKPKEHLNEIHDVVYEIEHKEMENEGICETNTKMYHKGS